MEPVTSRASAIEQFVLEAISIAGNLDRSTLHLDTNLYDIGFDSVSRVSVISQAESCYGVEFSSKLLLTAFEVNRIGDLVRLIDSMLNRQA